MASSIVCQCFFTLLFLAIVVSPLQINARESKFFSKVTRVEPENSKPETKNDVVSPSPSPAIEAETELGYGLFGKQETYQYSPTTKNPTKPESEEVKYVSLSKGEKQGMSDTRFLENGKYFYDVNGEKKFGFDGKMEEEDDGHESYYGKSYENGKQYEEERYERKEKQGVSDTRYWKNGKYFYDVNDDNNNDHGSGYSKSVEFYNRNKYEKSNEEEEEEEEEKFGNRVYGTPKRQGMSDTRFMENGKYFYDVGSEGPGVGFYNKGKNNEYYEKESNKPEKFAYQSERGYYNNHKKNEYSVRERYEPTKFDNEVESFDSNYENESEENNAKTVGYQEKYGKSYDFRRTPNKFPKYEFDSIDEYEKYEEARSHQKEYTP